MSFGILVGGVMYAVVLYGWGELLMLLVAMEENTFKTVKLLEDVIKDDDPMAAFEGRMGSELWSLSAADGKILAKEKLAETPIFDGMIVAGGQLYLCTQQGEIICMGRNDDFL